MDCRHHHHHNGHIERQGNGETRLTISLFITAGFMVAEAIGGIVFNSLALLADAGHMLSDAMALGLSLIAIRIGKRSPTDRHTFGFKRSEILAALLNGLTLWAIAGIILYEAVHRLLVPVTVAGTGMLLVASAGLAVNLIMAAILFRDRQAGLNLRGAFLHVLSDALGSVGAIVAATAIIFTGFYWADPMVSVLICALILYSSWGLVKESVHILMEGVPKRVDIRAVEEALLRRPGVCCVYDLHIWSITSESVALSAHVVLTRPDGDRTALLRDLNEVLTNEFGISHTTIQIECTHEMRPGFAGAVCREGTSCNVPG